jgi:hypothetical protein
MMKTPPAKPAAKAKDGRQVAPGGSMAPGTDAYRRARGAPRPPPVVIDKSFVKDPRGGKPLVVGKRHIRVKGDRSDPLR